MTTNSLQNLRDEIINRAQALALNGQVNEEDKLAVLMNLVRTGGASDEVVRAAFDAIDQLPDDDVKLETYLDLLYEVDQLIARATTPESSEEPAPAEDQPAEEPPQNEDQPQPEDHQEENFQG